jgi:hypothetical protein
MIAQGLVGIVILGALTGLPAAHAKPESVFVTEPTGEKIVITGAAIKQTPVYKGQMLVEMQAKSAAALRARQAFDSCSKAMESYQCWRMYGDELSKTVPQIPAGLERLAVDPLYVVLQYRVINVDLNGQKKLGDQALTACLNPLVPEGYWPVLNRFKPVLKYVAGGSADPRLPAEVLKARVCRAYVDFDALRLPKR